MHPSDWFVMDASMTLAVAIFWHRPQVSGLHGGVWCGCFPAADS
jgi:hypothetical protein